MLAYRRLSVALSIALLGPSGCDDGGGDGDESQGAGVETSTETGTMTQTGSATDDTSADPGCSEVFNAIVTDIDETLTTSDEEWITQIADGTHNPAARPGASELINSYADRGYRILYLTARPVTVVTSTGESAQDATMRWLEENGFPLGERTELQLAPNFVINSTAATYKTEALQQRQAAGWVFDYAYGNALSDIDGYEGAGVDKNVTFVIGEEAGAEGTQAVEFEGWVEHNQSHVANVPMVCSPDA